MAKHDKYSTHIPSLKSSNFYEKLVKYIIYAGLTPDDRSDWDPVDQDLVNDGLTRKIPFSHFGASKL